MKTITKYQADDGSEWDTRKQAADRDKEVEKMNSIMRPLGKVPSKVSNGKGYLQHDPEVVNQVKDDILEYCRKLDMHLSYPAFKSRGRDCHSRSMIGRILTDSSGPLSEAWQRIMCIGSDGREHQQPFYVENHPTNGPYTCVEDRRKKTTKH